MDTSERIQECKDIGMGWGFALARWAEIAKADADEIKRQADLIGDFCKRCYLSQGFAEVRAKDIGAMISGFALVEAGPLLDAWRQNTTRTVN